MSFLDEIGARLVAQGVGVLDEDIFLGTTGIIPPVGLVDRAYLHLKETGGLASAKTQNDTATQRPTAQLSSRAIGYPVARALLKKAYDALGGANGLYNLTLSGTWYVSIKSRQEPTDIGKDGTGRVESVFNIEVEKAPS